MLFCITIATFVHPTTLTLTFTTITDIQINTPSILLFAISTYFGFKSIPINLRPNFFATTPVVPEPAKGSNTTPSLQGGLTLIHYRLWYNLGMTVTYGDRLVISRQHFHLPVSVGVPYGVTL